MPKQKVALSYIVKHWFTYNPWLKLIALILAIMVWFYVRAEIGHFSY